MGLKLLCVLFNDYFLPFKGFDVLVLFFNQVFLEWSFLFLHFSCFLAHLISWHLI